MNDKRKTTAQIISKTLLPVLTCLLVACASPGRDRINDDARRQFVGKQVIGSMVESGLIYRVFKKHTNKDEFREKSRAILDSPRVRFVAKPNDERNGAIYDFGGLEFEIQDNNFWRITGNDRDLLSAKVAAGLVDGVLMDVEKVEKFGYDFSYWSEWDPHAGGFGLVNGAFLTVINNEDTTYLFAGSPLLMAHIVDVHEVRDTNKVEYKVIETFTSGIPEHKISIPTKTIAQYARRSEPLVIKIYGEMEQRRGLVSYVVKIPNWYLRAFIFAGLKHQLITPETAGPKLVSEFEELEKIPDPVFPDFPLKTGNNSEK